MKKKNKIISSAIIACGLTIAIAPTAIALNQQNNVHFNTSLAIDHSQDDSPLNLSNAKITLVSNDFKYTGNYIRPKFIVETNDNQILREDIDYNIRYYNNIEAGEGTILIFGMHEFYGYKTYSFTIEKAMDNEIQKFIIGENGYPVGEAKYGTVKFKYSEDNINWTDELPLRGYKYFAKAYVEDNKNFNGVESQNTLVFIRPQTFDISQCQINLSFNSIKYTGNEIKPGIAVIDIYHILSIGKDFEVHYENNIKPGIASVIIEGKGKYTGTQVKNFKIEKVENEISELIWYHNEPYATAKYGYVEFRYSKDKINWIDHFPSQEEGTWYVQGYVREGDIYLGIETPNILEFTPILSRDISKSTITIENNQDSFAFTGNAICPKVNIMDSYFNLIEGWDYYLEYENNINPGTATIKIIGMDRYINTSATINFTIKK